MKKMLNPTYRKKDFLLLLCITMAAVGMMLIVVQAAGRPKLNSQSMTLKVKQTKTLSVTNVKKSRIRKTVFKSSKKSVASVNAKGRVTGRKAGKTVITCTLTLKSGKKYILECAVTVQKDNADRKDDAESNGGTDQKNDAGQDNNTGQDNTGRDDNSSKEKPVVYMTEDISPDALNNIYKALGASPKGKIAVKLSTGEPGSNYLRTDLIGDLVKSLNGTIVECNTAYGGSRSNTAMHYQVAKDHGYTDIADVDIMDEDGSMTLPVADGSNLKENYVGAHFADYDYYVILSHFKGHAMAGYGGAIKNISIGIASSEGKAHIHSGGTGGSMWGGDQDAFLESMAEAGKSVTDALSGNILYINVMNRLSVDCDCDGNPAEPDMHDIGILASFDPVALDQACIDLVYAADDGASLIRRIESRNGLHTLEHAEKIGLGSRSYTLESIY